MDSLYGVIRRFRTVVGSAVEVSGFFVTALGFLLAVVLGLWGFIVELQIVYMAAGFWGVVIGFLLLPVTFVAAPWYALVAWHTWGPLVLGYGSLMVVALTIGGGVGLATLGTQARGEQSISQEL